MGLLLFPGVPYPGARRSFVRCVGLLPNNGTPDPKILTGQEPPGKKREFPRAFRIKLRLTRTNDKGRKATLTISKQDWIRIGQEAKWPIPDEVLNSATPQPDPPFKVEVRKYSERTWAVYVNGELLAVCCYRKGAFAVESVLRELAQRLQDAEGR